MPQSGSIHRDRPLENLSVARKTEGLIAGELFPTISVKKESDTYYIYDRSNMRRDLSLRANGAEANQTDFELSTGSYRLDEHALKSFLSDRDRENADSALNLEADHVESLTDKLNIERERDAATLLFTNGNWDNETSLAAALAWSANTTLSNPILNADSAASTILQNSGKKPNVCVVDFRTHQAAKEHTSIVDRVKYTSSESVGESLLAKLFSVEKYMVASGTNETAGEGLASSMAFLWTDSAWFGYVERSPGIRKVSALGCFKKGSGTTVRKWRDESRKGTWIETSMMYDQVNDIASDCGYLVVNTVQ